ncbi:MULTISPECIES: transcriptional regulator PocR [Enterobacteriaceae]|jgi:ligand-binding sensor protein/AraC-like DNA-binding protein|uniref:HTH araC/xylS-type domain-containing protein n=4 Tax=Enterobacteriaceae TaxID=543 RepID=A0AAC8QM50_9ENTR|nr:MULTISPECIES: regulatory protein PocR [Enterobacteriaceae]AUU91807.1 regulatory protein PocR [Enterobacteriaceae bacterium ENNIH3]AUV08147.1 regulatory protein PocR [Enterobacteriaceae bacterium ENNIH2]MBS6738441.1 regulatory protein PocR [Enterobacteriaceae bacterium]PTA92164.1 regulatory protein PocR [Kluyvera sp. Nf5]PWF49816.1 regulatory protein PocR [[Kluyvera] intestini]PXW62332.1 AraC family transcriptional regulator [Grimontella sp. AG753]QIH62804.1 regulatory protein PocR [Entero
MISASALNSELINKIAQDFAQATGLAVVVVNIHGEEISELFNFTPFCQLMRQNPQHSARCRMSDRCGGFEASKSNQPCIYRCHAGLTDFSIPLVIAGHLVGFVLCGQVRLREGDSVELINILNIDDRWQADQKLMDEFLNVPEMDYSRVIASADLLKLIVENCLKKQLNFVVIKDQQQAQEAGRTSRNQGPHDSKMKKALRYIDAHLSDELRLEDVAAHVYLSPYYFSKLFKKYQGIGFNAWVNRQRMASAKEMLCHSDWSIASIARNLGFSQTSYFCKVFRQTYQVTPQVFRLQNNANYDGD